MEYNRNSPTTSGGNTPTLPAGTEGNFIPGVNPQMAGMPGMGGMLPNMTPQMMYSMYSWMSHMGGMMPGAGGMGGMPMNMAGMGGMPGMGMGSMPPNMAGMGSMPPNMAGMGSMPPNMAGMGGPMQHRSSRESVYRPYIDLLSDDSPSTVPETQFAGFETFSFEELGLSPIREAPDEAEPAARGRGKGKAKARGGGRGGGRGKGKAKAPSCSSQVGAAEEEGDEERRTVSTVWENAALAKSWVGVVEDAYVGANQYIDRLWYRISEAYLVHKPAGARPRTPEQLRKQWDRLRPKLSRFASLYQNALRGVTSGMSEEDVKSQACARFPDKELKFKEFDQWEAFLVVRDSPKFCAGVDSGWKRTKINSSGEYSSSAGSHELPEADEVSPLPRSDSRRRRRPIGQKAAHRMARGSGSRSGSFEVESEAPAAPDDGDLLARAQLVKTLAQSMHRWSCTTNPAYKRMCKSLIDKCRRELGMPYMDDDGVEIVGGNVGGGSGTGDGDEDEEEDEEE